MMSDPIHFKKHAELSEIIMEINDLRAFFLPAIPIDRNRTAEGSDFLPQRQFTLSQIVKDQESAEALSMLIQYHTSMGWQACFS